VENQIQPHPVLEFRVALTSRDFQKSLQFYAEGLGIEPSDFWKNGDGQAVMFKFDGGSLEVFDEAQAKVVDEIETGQRLSGQIRLAFQVPDVQLAMDRLLAHGAKLIQPPVVTPWGDINVRLVDPDGIQCTLFQSGKKP
jgi:catechol 2,3-dioxygenase-like lactoylglutathione lyase family enzyme